MAPHVLARPGKDWTAGEYPKNAAKEIHVGPFM